MNDLPRVATGQRGGRESNPRPVDCKSIALTTSLPSQTTLLLSRADFVDVAGTPRGGMSSTDIMRPRQTDSIGDVNLGRNAGVTRDQLDHLRQDLRSSLNDTLFTRLHKMEEVKSRCSLAPSLTIDLVITM